MAAPIVFLGGLGLAVAVLFVLTRFGDTTTQGESVTIEFNGPCIDEALPLIEARAHQVGMPTTLVGRTMNTTLPDMENARVLIPKLLVTTGAFALQDAAGQTVFTNADIEDVAIDLDESGMPVTFIKLDAGARARAREMTDAEELVPFVDGASFRPLTVASLNDDAEVELQSGAGMTADRMKRAADLAIVLEHGPLPCAIRAGAVTASQISARP